MVGSARSEPRSKQGYEFDVTEVRVLNRSAQMMPFYSSADISQVSQEVLLDYRPLSLRHDTVNTIFRLSLIHI